MSQLRKLLKSRFSIIAIILILGGSVLYYIDSFLKKSAYEKRILNRNDTHERAVNQFQSSIDNFATLVSGMKSYIELSDEMPEATELQRFISNQLEHAKYNKELIVAFIDTTYTFQYVLTRNEIDPAELTGISLKDFRDESLTSELDKMLKNDGIFMFEPLNLKEGWIGIPLDFRVERHGIVTGHIGSLLNLKLVLDKIYQNIDSEEFVLKFSTDGQSDFDRQALYDGSNIYNDEGDLENYRHFNISKDQFEYRGIELYGQKFEIGIAFKKPSEQYTFISYVFLGWYILLIVLIILLIVSQSNYVKGLSIQFTNVSNKLIDQKKEISIQNDQVTKDLKFAESITQLSPAHIYIFELPELNMVYANRNISEYLGYSKDRYPTATGLMKNRLHPDDLSKSKDRIQHYVTLADDNSLATTLRIKNSRGEYKWFLGKEVVFSRKRDGSPAQILGIADDITHIKEIEIELAESEQKLKAAQTLAVIGYWEVDFETGGSEFSEEFSEIVGIISASDKRKLNQNTDYFREFIHPDDLEMVDKRLVQGLKDGKKYDLDYRLIDKNKKLKYIHSIVNMILDKKRRVIKTWGTIQDITPRKLVEEQLQKQYGALEQVNTELDRFVYSVTHDLKAPLSNIHGLIKVAQGEENKSLLSEYYSRIETSIQNMKAFIDDSINYAKNANLEVQKEEINLKLLFSEIIEEHKFAEFASAIKFDINIEGKQKIFSDRSRIRIVFNNLISNAIKYHDPSKKEQYVHVKCSNTEKNVSIKVMDNGSGIDSADHDKIFSMFYRTKSGSSQTTGSGIGLYILSEALKKIGGSISVESTLGMGTTFTVVIPNKP